MSRCFPFPPPGYVLLSRGSDKRPLIDSIKLQNDKEKSKEERRKEKKEKKKDKKRKRELQLNQIVDRFGQEKLNNEKSQKLDKQRLSLDAKYTKSHNDDVSSDVTEEHEQPVCVAKLNYSSMNIQKSERIRHESTANSIIADGTLLKIRLPSLKKKELDAIDRDDVWPSTSGRTNPIDQNDFGFGQRLIKEHPRSTSTSNGICVAGLVPNEKKPSLKSVDAEVSNQDVIVSKSLSRKVSKVEVLYKSLLENLAPASQVIEGYDDDEQDWLCSKKSQSTERSEISNNAPCSLDLNIWPRAQFLPSVDTYALPYTVPF